VIGADPGEVEITGHAQHRAWRRRDLPPVEELRTDLWSIPVPIPNSPLRYVSVYVFAGPAGLTLIDTGWDSDESWDALTAGLAEIGGTVTDVRGVLVTHMHFEPYLTLCNRS
jgi:Metallo-beta-lactamase superfamily